MSPGDVVALSVGLGRVLAVEAGRVRVSPGVAGPDGSWRPYAPATVVAVKSLRGGHWTRAEQTRIAGLVAARLTWSEIAAATGRSAKVCQYLYRLWRQG